MENKFRVLRFVGSLYKVIAWILLILGVLGGIGAILAGIFGNSAIGGQMADLTGLGTEGLLAGLALGVGHPGGRGAAVRAVVRRRRGDHPGARSGEEHPRDRLLYAGMRTPPRTTAEAAWWPGRMNASRAPRGVLMLPGTVL